MNLLTKNRGNQIIYQGSYRPSNYLRGGWKNNYYAYNTWNDSYHRNRNNYNSNSLINYYSLNNYHNPTYYIQNQFYSKTKPYYYNEREIQEEILYYTEEYIKLKYPSLLNINQRNSKLSETINEMCKFFVIKSLTEEDIHKSIKYGVWCSSKDGNRILNNAFNITKEKNGKVYLFFSSNGTGRFVGLARMKSEFDESRVFDLWTQDNKWIGLFDVEWLFIKDVPFSELKNIVFRMVNGETKSISFAKDSQEIPYQHAINMVEIFKKYLNSNTILEHFNFYDMRQENYENEQRINKNKKHKNNRDTKKSK